MPKETPHIIRYGKFFFIDSLSKGSFFINFTSSINKAPTKPLTNTTKSLLTLINDKNRPNVPYKNTDIKYFKESFMPIYYKEKWTL